MCVYALPTLLLGTVAGSVVAVEDPTQLDPINVEHAEAPTARHPLGIGIRGETLSSAPGSGGDPLRGLQSVPGMVFNEDESAEPAVRGSRPGDNYFQTDFAPTSYLFHMGGAISVYNADLVKSFDIYPSAYGPEFSGVTGGVFDVELRDPRTDHFQTTLDVSFLQAGFLVEGPLNDRQSFYLAGRRSYLDLFVKDLIDEPDIKFTDFPNYTDYQGKYVWQVSEGSTLRFSANGATDDSDLILSEDSEDIATDPVFAGRIYEALSFNEQSLVWDKNLAPTSSIRSIVTHNTLAATELAGGAGSIDVDEESWLLKSHLTHSLNDQHEVTVGAELSQTDISFDIALNAPACTEFEPDCLFTGAERLEVTETAKITALKAFAKDTWFVNDRLTLFSGLALQRENYLDKQFVEPRLALEYALRDDLLLTAGMGVYHQMPDIDQVNRVFGNPELDYIRARHASVGLQKSLGDGWSVSSELYYKKLDQLVTSDEETRYQNNGVGEAIGLDTLVRKQLTDKLSGWLSVSLSEATRRDLRTGRQFDFEYNQPVNATLVARYQFSPKWSVGAKLWAHSGAPYTPITGATPDPVVDGLYQPQYGDLNSKRLPVYKRLDLRVDRAFKRKGKRQTTAYFEVLNITGSRNISGYSYNADYSERTAEEQLPGFFGFGINTTF